MLAHTPTGEQQKPQTWPTAKAAVSGAACPSPTSPPTERSLLSMEEVSARCGRRSRGWAHKQVRLGRLRAFRDGRRFVVRLADLDAFIGGLEEA